MLLANGDDNDDTQPTSSTTANNTSSTSTAAATYVDSSCRLVVFLRCLKCWRISVAVSSDYNTRRQLAAVLVHFFTALTNDMSSEIRLQVFFL